MPDPTSTLFRGSPRARSTRSIGDPLGLDRSIDSSRKVDWGSLRARSIDRLESKSRSGIPGCLGSTRTNPLGALVFSFVLDALLLTYLQRFSGQQRDKIDTLKSFVGWEGHSGYQI